MKRRRPREARFAPGSYHTDGRRLCAVEACRSLELMLIAVDELDSLRLRPVRS